MSSAFWPGWITQPDMKLQTSTAIYKQSQYANNRRRKVMTGGQEKFCEANGSSRSRLTSYMNG